MATLTDALSTPWVERFTEIKLSLGELCIRRTRFRAAVLNDAAWRSSDSVQIREIQEKLKSGVEAVYLSSQPTQQRLSRLTFSKFGIRYVPMHFRRFYVDIRGTFDDYLRHFNSRDRNSLTRRVRRFAELSGGESNFREYRSASDMATFCELAGQVTRKTYQYKLLRSGLPQTLEFRRKLCEMAERDEIRAYILFLSREPVAFQYSSVFSDILTGQITGYDPDLRQHSPGFVLHYQVLSRLFSEERFRIFDFGGGDASYKEFFATGNVQCAAVYYFPYTPKNVGFVILHSSARLASASAVKVLSLLHLNEWIKKSFRRV